LPVPATFALPPGGSDMPTSIEPAPLGLSFLGAAGEVTGSCFRVDGDGVRFLVDCGLFQGGRDADAKNASALDFDVKALDFVILTHAHIDHSGLLPRLAARGFRGPIYATPATIDLLGVMLPDSAHIQEKDAEWAREREADSRRHAADRRPHAGGYPTDSVERTEPLYTVAEAEACLRQLKPVAYDRMFVPHPGVRFRFRDAGHILGAAIAEVWVATDAGERGKRRNRAKSGSVRIAQQRQLRTRGFRALRKSGGAFRAARGRGACNAAARG
jgi:metallo-beta-lactamase family protein